MFNTIKRPRQNNLFKYLNISIFLALVCVLFTGCGKRTTFDDALEFSENLAAVKVNGFYGYVDTDLNMIIEPSYSHAKSFHNGVALVKKASSWGAIDKDNNIVIPFKYDEVPSYSNEAVVVNNYSKYGCINYEGQVIVDFIYDDIDLYTFYVECNYAVPSDMVWYYDDLYPDSTKINYAVTYEDGLCGFIDFRSGFTIDPKYTDLHISQSDKDIVTLQLGDHYGFADLKSETMVEPIFLEPIEFSEGLAVAESDTFNSNNSLLYGYIDKTGKFVIDPMYSSASSFHDGLAAVEDVQLQQTGYINKNNEFIIPPTFKKAYDFQNGSAVVKVDTDFTLIDTKGTNLLDTSFMHISFPHPDNPYDSTIGFGLYRNANGDYDSVVLDNKGNILFYADYSTMGAFKNDILIVGSSDKYGFINNRGIEIVPLIYDNVYETTLDHIFLAELEGLWGAITSSNEEILPFKYHSVDIKMNNLIVFEIDKKYGFYNISNKALIEPLYDEIRPSISNEITAVKQGEKWFYIDAQGNKLN